MESFSLFQLITSHHPHFQLKAAVFSGKGLILSCTNSDEKVKNLGSLARLMQDLNESGYKLHTSTYVFTVWEALHWWVYGSVEIAMLRLCALCVVKTKKYYDQKNEST